MKVLVRVHKFVQNPGNFSWVLRDLVANHDVLIAVALHTSGHSIVVVVGILGAAIV